MRILFLHGQAFLPQIAGGIESSTFELCEALTESGHSVFVMCGLMTGDLVWLKNRLRSRLQRRLYPMDRYSRTRIFRGWNFAIGLSEVLDRAQPDAVVVQGSHSYETYQYAAACIERGHHTFYYAHDLRLALQEPPIPTTSGLHWIANSSYTAMVLASRLGVSAPVVPPLIRPTAYRVTSSRRSVTMINPRPGKGGDIALTLATACPDVPFTFVEAWGKADQRTQEIKNAALRLPNVRWQSSQHDMRVIYADTRILLAPSRYPETWGRVITEAQFSGIPALVSNRGAYPETTGGGGILLDPDDHVDEWIRGLRLLWDNEDIYSAIAQAALEHSQRPAIAEPNVTAAFERALIDTDRES